MKLNFLDIVENGYASEDNPTRIGYVVYVRNRRSKLNPGRYVELTDGKGKFWEVPLSNDRLRVIGNLLSDKESELLEAERSNVQELTRTPGDDMWPERKV